VDSRGEPSASVWVRGGLEHEEEEEEEVDVEE